METWRGLRASLACPARRYEIGCGAASSPALESLIADPNPIVLVPPKSHGHEITSHLENALEPSRFRNAAESMAACNGHQRSLKSGAESADGKFKIQEEGMLPPSEDML